MYAFNVILFVILMGSTQVKSESRTKTTDDLNNYRGGSIFYKIRPSGGGRIILRIDHIRLQHNGYIKLRDGKRGKQYKFTALGFGIYDENGDLLSLPYTLETENPKLYIWIEGGRSDQFSARYTTFFDDSCRKEDLVAENGEAEISCDTDELSPVARTCDVTIPCANNYVQYRTQKICNTDGNWEGDIKCLPDADLLESCTYDFESMETNGNCPFNVTDVTEYYIDVEDVDPYDKVASLGRSARRKSINCRSICARRGGVFTFRCPRFANRRNRGLFVKCLICKIHLSCRLGRPYFS